MGSNQGGRFPAVDMFGTPLFFPTIPTPLRQYTFWKKDDPFRSLLD